MQKATDSEIVENNNTVTKYLETAITFIRIPDYIRTEIVRKSIHLLVALIPLLAKLNFGVTVALLSAGVIVYTYAETLRNSGLSVFFISKITALAARERDRGKFVLGPVTLGLGTLLALLLYPSPAAAIAIYALAFGDGFASLAGRSIRSPKVPLFSGKTIAGSLACFISVYAASYLVLRDFRCALLVSVSATFLELIPWKDLDNIIIPIGTGLVATLIL